MSGDYVFEAQVDDFVTVRVGGKTVLKAQSYGKGKPVELEAGVPVPITVDYREEYSDAILKLYWTPPGGEKEIIPTRVLLPITAGNKSEVVDEGNATDPRGAPRKTRVSVGRRGRVLEVDGAAIPGLYQLKVPESLRSEIEELAEAEVPLVVKRDVRESRMTSLDDDDRTLVRKEIDLVEARSVSDLLAILSGKGFGQELWKFLAIAAFFLILLEVALARWISKARRSAEDVKVEFEERGGPNEAILEKMSKMKKAG